MLVKKAPDLTYKDVTPKSLYMGRRNFLLAWPRPMARWWATRN